MKKDKAAGVDNTSFEGILSELASLINKRGKKYSKKENPGKGKVEILKF